MNHRINLSISHNMALGFVPVIVSILLCEFVSLDSAIYAGTLTGLLYMLVKRYKKPRQIPNFVLYITTAVLLLFSAVSLLMDIDWPKSQLPITLEIAVILPLLFVYGSRVKFVNYFKAKPDSPHKHKNVEGAEVAMVSIGSTLVLALVHFATLTVYILLSRLANPFWLWVLVTLSPLLVFIFAILFNQLGIRYFNKEASDMVFVPVINKQEGVTGKLLREDIPGKKNKIIVPMVRIAIECQGMLFLTENADGESGKADTPLSSYVFFKENISDSVNRILKGVFSESEALVPLFHSKYFFKNDKEYKLVYLFVLHLDSEKVLDSSRNAGKFWTLQQIEQNLNKNFFSNYFEYEYEHLKALIDIRDEYKK